MPTEKNRPEWVPDGHDAHHGFTTSVMKGLEDVVSVSDRRLPKRRKVSADELVEGIRSGERTLLSRAITLVESRSDAHRETAQAVLERCLPHSGRSVRIGITGTPGAGKSTFIEAFGQMLCRDAHKVAVLAVDPSSRRTGGSVLGDKTRMEDLSREPNAYIRPSPSGGALGGVAAKTRETLLLCEAAGYDVIIVETVGVGQSEVSVRDMVDFFLVLQIAGGGDELQGIKKGVIELADAIAVNKADGDNLARANAAKGEYNRVLHYLQPATPSWKSVALTCSAITGDGISEIWNLIRNFCSTLEQNGEFAQRRRQQNVQWMNTLIRESLEHRFFSNAAVQQCLKDVETGVRDGGIPVAVGVSRLLNAAGLL